MDTATIPINLSSIYDVLLTCLALIAFSWSVPKVIQLLKRL